MKKEDRLMTEEEALHNSLHLILHGHYTRKMALYRSSKPEENCANPIHLHLLFIFRLKYFLESKNKKLQNSIQIHTTQNWKGTGTNIYTHCYSILTYSALRCNLDVLMEKISNVVTIYQYADIYNVNT